MQLQVYIAFNSVGLSDGIAFTTLVIGLFSVSEILLMLERTTIGQVALKQGKRSLLILKSSFLVGCYYPQFSDWFLLGYSSRSWRNRCKCDGLYH